MREMNLPEGWKWVRLGEVLEESKLRVKDIESERAETIVIYSLDRYKGLIPQNQKFDKQVASKDLTNYKVLMHGFLAYGFPIDEGVISFLKEEVIACVSPAYYVFKPKTQQNIKFFDYLVRSDFMIKEYVNHSLQTVERRKIIKPEFFKNIQIPLPPLPQQKKIAEILETVDKIIEKTEKIIEKYKRIKQGLMQELFTKGIDENGKIRDEKTHRFKDSPIGRIPEEWEVVRLGDILKYEQPYKYIVKDTNYTKTGIPVLTAGKSFILGYTQESEGVYQNLPVIIFDDFTTDNKFVDFPFKVKSSAMKFLRPKNENINLRFVYETMQTLKYDYVSGDHKRRWISEFQHFLIPLPPLPEQERIAQTLSQIDKVIESEQKYKQKLESLKRGLMEDLLTGRVRVNLLE